MIYLLRVNLDIAEKNPAETRRFKAALETIDLLLKKKHRVVVMSHFGRPKGPDIRFSLKRFQKLLRQGLERQVVFFPNFNFSEIKKGLVLDKQTKVFLMENMRFMSGEEKNSAVLAKELASLGDRYMNDDFATSHRKDASIAAIAKFMPAEPGPHLLEEIKSLKRATVHPKKPLTLLIGGAKMKDKIGVVKRMLPKADCILLGGGAANVFIKASGVDIKSSLYEADMFKIAAGLLKNKKIILPADYRWAGNKIMDIGPKTIRAYTAIIKKSGTVIWGGPMGYFEKKSFAAGSYKIARAIAASKCFSVVGGGETGEIVSNLKLQKKISFLSLGGGAMLSYLAHEEMPGLEALKIRY
jgi:phosphoglycerate kinase